MQDNNTTPVYIAQEEILCDIGREGKPRPWAQHRTEADYMALAYEEVNPSKAEKIRSCGSWLEFAVKPSGALTLHNANFCRIRLCPMCQWRRSLKIWSQTSDLVAAANTAHECKWAMLTLTQKNVDDYQLPGELDLLYKAWDKFSRRKEYRRAVLGHMRVLEVTHNTDYCSSSYDSYHPHFHVLLALKKSYFNSRDYIKQSRWRQMWKEAMDLNYLPEVEIHEVKGECAGAIAEVSKYATKPADVLMPDNWDVTVRTVEILDHALNSRRLVAYGGILRQLHRQIHLDDAENGDLIHTDADDKIAEQITTYASYNWAIGYRQYIRGKVRKGARPDAEKEKARCARVGTTPSERRAAIAQLENPGTTSEGTVHRLSGEK